MCGSLVENVAVGLWPAVEGRHLAARKNQSACLNPDSPQGFLTDDAFSAGLEAAALRQPGWPTLHFSNGLFKDSSTGRNDSPSVD